MNNFILAISDTHCNFQILEKIIEKELAGKNSIKAVLHCGDLGIYDTERFDQLPKREQHLLLKHQDPYQQFRPYLTGEKEFKIPIYAIAGNHEDFVLFDEIQQGRVHITNINLLRPNELITIPETVFKIMGLGKVLPLGLLPHNRNQGKIIQDEDINLFLKTAKSNQPNILLFHETPYMQQIKSRSKRTYGNPEISRIISEINPEMVLTGHIHREYTSFFSNTLIYGLGYGTEGRYAIINENFKVTFKTLTKGKINVYEFSILDRLNFTQQGVDRKKMRPERILTAKQIIQHFELDAKDMSLKESLSKLSRKICEMHRENKITELSEALRIAEVFLKERNHLNENLL